MVDTDDRGDVLTVAVATFDPDGDKVGEVVTPFGPFDPAAHDLATYARLLLVGQQGVLF